VYITSPKKTAFHLVSIMISTLTTAFGSAMVSFDMDVSVANREKSPEFNGYVKDTNLERSLTFLVMILLAALQNLSRTIGVALLLAVSGSTTFVFFGAEMAFYIGFKVLRNDFVTFIPGLEGTLKYTVALAFHSLIKVLADYTGERYKIVRSKVCPSHTSHSPVAFIRHDLLSWMPLNGRFHILALVHSWPGAALRCAIILLHEHYSREQIKSPRDQHCLDSTSLLLGLECNSVLQPDKSQKDVVLLLDQYRGAINNSEISVQRRPSYKDECDF